LGAQFWLEWRRQGWALPGAVGVTACLLMAIVFIAEKPLAEAGEGDNLRNLVGSLLLALPLVFSSTTGTNMARFDSLQTFNALPIYIGVRPMTNGGFIIAKLAMALVSSILAWLVMLAIAGFWLLFLDASALISMRPMPLLQGLVALVIGGVPALLLLILFTWKNLIGGISAGLTGRRWVVLLLVLWKSIFMIGLIALVLTAHFHESLKESLLRWLPALLGLGLAAKVALAAAAFAWALRRKAITAGGIGCLAGGWLLCGALVASYAGLVCHVIQKTDLWLSLALAGFMMLPLAELAVAPLALAWNRHR
jgi:hypothetical protein